MTLRAKIELAIAAVLLVGGVLAFRSWLAEHDLRLHAEEQTKAQAAVQSEAAEQIKALQKQMAERDAQYQSQLQTLDTKFSRAATPDQLAQLVSQLMGLKAPIQVVTPPASDGNAHPAPVAQIPQIDFPQAKAYLQECEECKVERAKLQGDAADRAAQMAAAQKQIESLQKDVKTWETAAKGGSWWQRTKRAAKWLVVGGAIGGAALCSTGHCKL